MHVVLTHHTNKTTRDGGANDLIELLEFVASEWERYKNSKRLTMRDLIAPSHITHLVIDGMPYELKGRRALWFEKSGRGYNPDRFYVSEAVDIDGHPFQLHLDRSRGHLPDDLRVIKAKPLGIVRLSRAHATNPNGMA